jgi:hypothetical protein
LLNALCQPVSIKRKTQTVDGSDETDVYTRFTYRPRWFGLAQTDGAELPPLATPAWGAARALGALDVTEVPFDALDGNVLGFARGRSIAVSPINPLPHKTCFHRAGARPARFKRTADPAYSATKHFCFGVSGMARGSSRFANKPDSERRAIGPGDELLRWPAQEIEDFAGREETRQAGLRRVIQDRHQRLKRGTPDVDRRRAAAASTHLAAGHRRAGRRIIPIVRAASLMSVSSSVNASPQRS